MPTRSTSGYYKKNVVKLEGTLAKAPEVHEKVAFVTIRLERGTKLDGTRLSDVEFPVTIWNSDLFDQLKSLPANTAVKVQGRLAWRPRKDEKGGAELSVVASQFEATVSLKSKAYQSATSKAKATTNSDEFEMEF